MIIKNNGARAYTIGGVSLNPGDQKTVPDEYYDEIQEVPDLKLIGTAPDRSQESAQYYSPSFGTFVPGPYKIGVQPSSLALAVALAEDTQFPQLPTFLGPNTSNAALPVTIASDQSPVDISMQSGIVSLTPVVTAGTYVANRCVGGMLTFSGVTRSRAQGSNSALQSGVLQSIKITSKSVQTDTFIAYLFNGNVSASGFADNVAPNIVASDVPKCIGSFVLNNPQSGLGIHTVWNLDGIGKLLNLPNTNLYVVLVRSGTNAYASTSDIEVTIGVMRD